MSNEDIAAAAQTIASNHSVKTALRAVLKNGGCICISGRPAAHVTRGRQAAKAHGLLTWGCAGSWTVTKLGRRGWNFMVTNGLHLR